MSPLGMEPEALSLFFIIFSVPFKILHSHIHTLDILALRAGPKQDEGGVGRETNGIGWKSVRAAAKEDFGVPSIFATWQCTAVAVSVFGILVIPEDPSFS